MKRPDTTKPLGVDSLAAETSKGSDQTSMLNARLDRYSTAKRRAVVNQNHLKGLHEHLLETETAASRLSETVRLAHSRLSRCGNYLKFNNYYTVGKVRLTSARFCKQHLICPLCAIRRGAKTLEVYLDRYGVIMKENPTWKLSMITLTVKNGDDLKERFEHLRKSVKTVFDRRRDYFKKGRGRTELRKVHGYVGTYEVTNKGNGWHPHAHIMVLHTESFDYKELQREWKDITGDSHVLNVSAAKNPDKPEKDFLEVFKYAVKFSDLSPEDNLKAFLVLKGKRLLFSGGAFRGVKIPEKLEDDPLEDLPYIEMFYRFIDGNYNLDSMTQVDPSTPTDSSEVNEQSLVFHSIEPLTSATSAEAFNNKYGFVNSSDLNGRLGRLKVP